MTDSKYFGIPFGASGDRATIPEATDAGGYVSYQQGFGPDYERDPASDPLAKRVPRDETNEYLYQITNALKYIQLYGLPEWFDEDAAGGPVSYPVGAQVRHDAGSGTTAWLSIAAANTAEPGTDSTKWVLASGYSWQHITTAIADAGLTPNPADTSQLAQAIRLGGIRHGTVVYSAPGPRTFTAPVTGWFWVECYGGGGGGALYSDKDQGEGGGGGGYAGKWVFLTAGAAVAVTVGSGGTSHAAGNDNGVPGGTSSFGAYCSATGGGSGKYSGGSGAGGTGTGGDINLTGQSGTDGLALYAPAGIGGDCAGPFGGKSAQAGGPATWPGGGGSVVANGSGHSWAGAGAPGGVIIRY